MKNFQARISPSETNSRTLILEMEKLIFTKETKGKNKNYIISIIYFFILHFIRYYSFVVNIYKMNRFRCVPNSILLETFLAAPKRKTTLLINGSRKLIRVFLFITATALRTNSSGSFHSSSSPLPSIAQSSPCRICQMCMSYRSIYIVFNK